jgi:hypothetical protein
MHPDCLQRGYVFGGSFLLSLSEVKRQKATPQMTAIRSNFGKYKIDQ